MAPIAQVVQAGMCVGCGACRVATNGKISMKRDESGRQAPILAHHSSEQLTIASAVCPFSGAGPNEDELAASRFSTLPNSDRRVGRYLKLGAGRIADRSEVMASSSGGLTSWVLDRMLEAGHIDGVIHVGATPVDNSHGDLFAFSVSESVAEIHAKRKSQYYACEFSEALLSIKGNGKRYAIVGVPCYIKAARLLAQLDAELGKQLQLFVALVCGHMKTRAFAELLAWQVGIPPNDLARVDFRVKEKSTSADDYHFSAWRHNDTNPVTTRTRQLYGHNWGHAMFQLKSCDFCDDIFGETADVCFGDAWLPEFAGDPRGTNIVVIRSAKVDAIIQQGLQAKQIEWHTLNADATARSQEGNFRHRWDGLAVRLHDDRRAKLWTPKKRDRSRYADVNFLRRTIVRLRRALSERSHEAFKMARQKQDLNVFFRKTKWLVKAMGLVYKLPLLFRPKVLLFKLGRKSGLFH